MRKYIINTQNPTKADQVAKDVGIDYINKFKEQSSSVENPIIEATKGNICSGQKRKLEDYNDTVSRGVPGQVVEIHGNRETGTIMAKFENKDGSLAHEVLTSADTPPHINDRDEYYENFSHMLGQRDESFLPSQETTHGVTQAATQVQGENDTSNPSINEGENAIEPTVLETVPNLQQDTGTEAISNPEEYNINNSNDNNSEPTNDLNLGGSSSVLSKRKLENSDEESNKRSKKDDDDNSKSGGTGIGGSGPISGGESGNDSSSAGPSNFKTLFDKTLIIVISITTSILDTVNEISTLL